MNIYLISQTKNNDWDTFDNACVAAPDEETARNMSPSGGNPVDWDYIASTGYSDWAYKPEQVEVELIGTSIDNFVGVICASFRAG